MLPDLVDLTFHALCRAQANGYWGEMSSWSSLEIARNLHELDSELENYDINDLELAVEATREALCM